MAKSDSRIVMYTSNFCGHSWAVERLLSEHRIPVKLINIDGNSRARRKLMNLNHGYASVPTLIFPDGTRMTEPSIREIRAKLDITTPGIMDKIKGVFNRDEE